MPETQENKKAEGNTPLKNHNPHEQHNVKKESLGPNTRRRGGHDMPKDSQPDPKEVRKAKANGQTPLTRENQNHNRNAKKKSIRNNDV